MADASDLDSYVMQESPNTPQNEAYSRILTSERLKSAATLMIYASPRPPRISEEQMKDYFLRMAGKAYDAALVEYVEQLANAQARYEERMARRKACEEG